MNARRSAFARSVASLLLASLLGVAMAACGGSGNDDSAPPDPSLVTGVATCTEGSLAKGVQAWTKAYGGGGKATLQDDPGSSDCRDGWAVVYPTVGSGNEAVTVTVVLQAEGQFWIPKDRAKVCGSSAADSQVPESLYQEACQTN